MRKRLYGILLGAMLLLLAICTYASNQIYRAGLPRVRVVAAGDMELRHNWLLEGTLYHKTPKNYALSVDTCVLQWNVQPGMWVAEGELLLQLDIEQLRMQWLRSAAEEERLRRRQDGSSTNEQLLLAQQVKNLQKMKKELTGIIDHNGWLCAKEDGLVLECAISNPVAADAPLVVLGPENGRKQLVFSLAPEQYAYCSEGTCLLVNMVEGAEKVEHQLPVDRVYYDAVTQNYKCVVVTEAPVNMMEGQSVTARLSATSPRYASVIPSSAVIEKENGNASYYVLREKQTILGTEYYAELRSAYILEENDIYTAINASISEPVVSYWSAPLTDQTTVCITEE